jgi:hypothetical protein
MLVKTGNFAKYELQLALTQEIVSGQTKVLRGPLQLSQLLHKPRIVPESDHNATITFSANLLLSFRP